MILVRSAFKEQRDRCFGLTAHHLLFMVRHLEPPTAEAGCLVAPRSGAAIVRLLRAATGQGQGEGIRRGPVTRLGTAARHDPRRCSGAQNRLERAVRARTPRCAAMRPKGGQCSFPGRRALVSGADTKPPSRAAPVRGGLRPKGEIEVNLATEAGDTGNAAPLPRVRGVSGRTTTTTTSTSAVATPGLASLRRHAPCRTRRRRSHGFETIKRELHAGCFVVRAIRASAAITC